MELWNQDTKSGTLPQEFSLEQGTLDILNFTDHESKELKAVLRNQKSPMLRIKKTDAPSTKNYFFSTPKQPILKKENGMVFILSQTSV